MTQWMNWFGELGTSVVDGGAPFGPSKQVASDGSVRDAGAAKLTGYSIIEAASLDDAASRQRDVRCCPAAERSTCTKRCPSAEEVACAMRPVDVTTSVTINAPVDQVATYAADPQNAPNWYANIRAVELLTPELFGVGSRMAFVARFLGRTLRYTYEIVEFDAGTRLVMRTAQGPFPMETTYEWVPAEGEGGTVMTLRNRGEPAGFSKVVAPFMSASVKRANQKDLARLKAIVENA
jgi:uncharacterized membrane protein